MKKISVYILIILSVNFLFAQNKPDALQHYRTGRNLDYVGRTEEAIEEYSTAASICLKELKKNPKNMDSHAVYTWALFRLKKYTEAVIACQKALKIEQDPRVIETLGESFFYVNNFSGSLREMEKYVNMAPTGERVSVAYFFQGEIYRLQKKFNKADISYTTAVTFEPNIALWWYKLGLVRESSGDKQNAIVAYSRAIKLSPNYAEANNALNRIK